MQSTNKLKKLSTTLYETSYKPVITQQSIKKENKQSSSSKTFEEFTGIFSSLIGQNVNKRNDDSPPDCVRFENEIVDYSVLKPPNKAKKIKGENEQTVYLSDNLANHSFSGINPDTSCDTLCSTMTNSSQHNVLRDKLFVSPLPPLNTNP